MAEFESGGTFYGPQVSVMCQLLPDRCVYPNHRPLSFSFLEPTWMKSLKFSFEETRSETDEGPFVVF